MQNSNPSSDNRHALSAQEKAQVGVLLFVTATIGLLLYVAETRYHLLTTQLMEGTIYLVCLLGAICLVTHYLYSYRDKLHKTWPRVPIYITPEKDRTYVQAAFEQNAIVLGYDHKKPCLWPDAVRRMQSILLGAPGSGKTTVLRNIIVQDVQRTVGDGRRVPIIIFDGKGDGEVLKKFAV